MTAAQRTILMLVTDAYGGRGGIAAYNRDAARALCEDPATRKVVAIARAAARPGPLPEKLSYRVPRGGVAGYVLCVLWTLLRCRFDVVYCAHVNLAPVALLVSRMTRTPWLLAIYGIEAWQRSPRPLVAFAELRADHVMSISLLTLERFQSFSHYPRNRTSIAPNAIHLEEFGLAPPNSRMTERWRLRGRKIILTLGRMESSERYKGFDEIIELMPELVQAVPDVVYVAAGDGTDRPRLRSKVASLGLDDRVVFTGFVSESEKADLYRLADVYAMPSSGEGFGFVFLEALACGTPVVASALDGGREAVLDGRLGHVVDPRDRRALRDAILSAMSEAKRIHPALSHFAWPEFARRLRELMEQLVRPKAPA
jgi:glycosyltransferase involved in cell wall biosynthesis